MFQKGFKRVFKGFPKGFKAFPTGFQRVSKRFKRVSNRFQRVSRARVSKGFPKGFKPSETGFRKGFRAISNPLENAFVDKMCFRMEGHKYNICDKNLLLDLQTVLITAAPVVTT